jgi:hypothetical protein
MKTPVWVGNVALVFEPPQLGLDSRERPTERLHGLLSRERQAAMRLQLVRVFSGRWHERKSLRAQKGLMAELWATERCHNRKVATCER